MASATEEEIVKKLNVLKCQAEQLTEKCKELEQITGIKRLAKKCEAELRFLQRLETNLATVQESRLNSSNLSHLQGIISLADRLSEVKEVLRVFTVSGCVHPLVVDIICNAGYVWIKVIAKNTKALELDLAGQQEFGEKSVISQAEIYVNLATLHAHNFVTPRVIFVFFHSVPAGLRVILSKIGVRVCEADELLVTDVSSDDKFWKTNSEKYALNNFASEASDSTVTVDVEKCVKIQSVKNLDCSDTSAENFTSKSEKCEKEDGGEVVSSLDKFLVVLMSPREVPVVTKVNLDVTALIALVSNVCHGACNFVFNDAVLSEQAAEERENPVLPSLRAFLQDKEMTACDTALRDFGTILDTIGGPLERDRAELLLTSVRQVADNPSTRAATLRSSARVTDRARIVFGTGDSERAVTMSANAGFVRAASQAGVVFTVFLHGARALTERKEANAKPYVT